MDKYLKFIFGLGLYMFRTVALSIIRGLALYTRNTYKLCWPVASKIPLATN